jgi:hypothetical protein
MGFCRPKYQPENLFHQAHKRVNLCPSTSIPLKKLKKCL